MFSNTFFFFGLLIGLSIKEYVLFKQFNDAQVLGLEVFSSKFWMA